MRIVFQILFILVMLVGVVYFLSQNDSRSEAYKKIIIVLVLIIGAAIFIFPGISDEAARFLGIESGLALVLYIVIALVFYILLRISIIKKRQQKDNAKQVRKIAILERKIDDLSIGRNKK